MGGGGGGAFQNNCRVLTGNMDSWFGQQCENVLKKKKRIDAYAYKQESVDTSKRVLSSSIFSLAPAVSTST